MHYWLYALLLLMATNNHAEPSTTSQGIESLSWMVGSWKGTLGPQTVEEAWSPPKLGSMDTMIRLSSPEGVQMIELIVIREVHDEGDKDSLMLHLRQFSPALELRTSQDMQLKDMGLHSVSFVANEGESIKQLAYTLAEPDQLKVEVTTATGDVLTARLQRN